MKRIKLSIICTAALLLALPFAGCMHADSGDTNANKATELTQETENECPDGDCNDGEHPEKDDECPDCERPERKMPPRRRHRRRAAEPLPCPICGDNN